MIKTMPGLHDIQRAKEDLHQLKQTHPSLYEQFHHVVSLTRQLQVRYSYLGGLLTDRTSEDDRPAFMKESVLDLYMEEVQQLKARDDFSALSNLLEAHDHVGCSKLSLMVLGARPEMIQGSSFIK
ncbi:hypothetical protein [Sinobaca sp. H24]|uniref:hypothetical protein n=1 Tax=Sinobaca sp. H24 TaxID=2923376 RepID=UPI00207A5F94|nr:hypothetical protein [Sinobaca sp. H24]